MKFAKLFDLENGSQVLFFVERCNDADDYKVIIKCGFEDFMGTLKMGFSEEEKALKKLESIDLDFATKVREEMLAFTEQ